MWAPIIIILGVVALAIAEPSFIAGVIGIALLLGWLNLHEKIFKEDHLDSRTQNRFSLAVLVAGIVIIIVLCLGILAPALN